MKFSQQFVSRFPIVAVLGALSASSLIACDREEKAAPLPAEKTVAEKTPGAAPPVTAPGPDGSAAPVKVVWSAPKDWKEMPARPMRKATFQADGKKGPAEIAIFYFGPADGGGVEANIARWIGQFQGLSPDEAKRSENKVGELAVHEVRVANGTYASGMPGGPAKSQEGWGMHAAVVETPGGSYFFKMLGPAETVVEQEANFTNFLRSLRIE